METIILQGESKSDLHLLLELAKKLNFKARKLSRTEIEDMSLSISINEGIKSGLLDEKEKQIFLNNLKNT